MPERAPSIDAPRRRNARTGVVLTGIVFGMIGLSFASVPLYRLFCQVTGYGGTTQIAEVAPGAVAERVIKVRFNADIAPGLPWYFKPVQREIAVRIGEPGLATYRARNLSDLETLLGEAATLVLVEVPAGLERRNVEGRGAGHREVGQVAGAEVGQPGLPDP